jgi:imidazoleglycerol-phosphate dehydratase
LRKRSSEIVRKTGETNVAVRLELDGQGRASAETGLGFFDHMLNLLGHHSRVNLEIKAEGDLEVDDHHLVEDVGLALGRALSEALSDKKGIQRYGSVLVPMDEVLVAAVVDLSGRPVYVSNYEPIREQVGSLSTEMVSHFFSSLAAEAKLTLHLRVMEPGKNEHHRIEALFKGFARALRNAVRVDSESQDEIPSTKGVL